MEQPTTIGIDLAKNVDASGNRSGFGVASVIPSTRR